jgi:hypothetical protein
LNVSRRGAVEQSEARGERRRLKEVLLNDRRMQFLWGFPARYTPVKVRGGSSDIDGRGEPRQNKMTHTSHDAKAWNSRRVARV